MFVLQGRIMLEVADVERRKPYPLALVDPSDSGPKPDAITVNLHQHLGPRAKGRPTRPALSCPGAAEIHGATGKAAEIATATDGSTLSLPLPGAASAALRVRFTFRASPKPNAAALLPGLAVGRLRRAQRSEC